MDGGDQVVQKNFPIDVCGEHLDLDHEVDVDVGDVKKTLHNCRNGQITCSGLAFSLFVSRNIIDFLHTYTSRQICY